MGRSEGLPVCIVAMVMLSSMMGGLKAQDISNCSATVSELESCLQFVLGRESIPSSSCCGNLKTAIDTDSTCVCEVVEYGLNNLQNFQISQVNLTLVQELPSLCSINASLSTCGITPNSTASPPSSSQGTLSPPPSSDHGDAGTLFWGSKFSMWRFTFPALVLTVLLFVFAPDLMALLDTS